MTINESNPDSAAMSFIAQLLTGFEFEWPDGAFGSLRQVDQGFVSKPTHNPYVSVQAVGSRAPIVRLGQGAGVRARDFEIDLLITIEYEDPNAEQGSARVSQLKWDVFRLLAQNASNFPGFELADFDEAILQSYNNDDGDFQDWGYIAQVIIPVTVRLRGTDT